MGEVIHFEEYKNKYKKKLREKTQEQIKEEWIIQILKDIMQTKSKLITDVEHSYHQYQWAVQNYVNTIYNMTTLLEEINKLHSTKKYQNLITLTTTDDILKPLTFLSEKDIDYIKHTYLRTIENKK